MIAVAPAFDVAHTVSTPRRPTSTHVGAAQGAAEPVRHPQLVNGERFFHAFFQAVPRWIEIHQLAMDGPGRAWRRRNGPWNKRSAFSGGRFRVLSWQVIDDVAFFVYLAALDESRVLNAACCGDRCNSACRHPERAAVSRSPIRAPLTHSAANSPRPCFPWHLHAQHRLWFTAANTKGCDHLPVPEGSAIDQHRNSRSSPSGRSINRFTFLAVGFDSSRSPPISRRHRHCGSPTPPLRSCGEPAHHLVPHSCLHRAAALKQLVAAQALFTLVFRSQPALDR